MNASGFAESFRLTIYGAIIDGYESEFNGLFKGIDNVEYRGPFDAVKNDVYFELNQHDVSVSSSWCEGMSGTNIECKFAGVANIVSDVGFNPECVHDGIDGLLVNPRDVNSLVNAMKRVIEDHELLYQLKVNSFRDRMHYDTSTWREDVLRTVYS